MQVAQAVLGARGDAFHFSNQPFTGLILAPVSRNQGPHHDAQIESTRDTREPRIAHAKRRTKPLRGLARCPADRVAASPHLVSNLRLAKPKKIRVRFGVIASGVPARDKLSHQLRTFSNKSADQKKCRARLVAI